MRTFKGDKGNAGCRVAPFGKSLPERGFFEPAAGSATIPVTGITD
jgi:hypothetical protein